MGIRYGQIMSVYRRNYLALFDTDMFWIFLMNGLAKKSQFQFNFSNKQLTSSEKVRAQAYEKKQNLWWRIMTCHIKSTMSRIACKYCLTNTSYRIMTDLFVIFILLHIWKNYVCYGELFTWISMAPSACISGHISQNQGCLCVTSKLNREVVTFPVLHRIHSQLSLLCHRHDSVLLLEPNNKNKMNNSKKSAK